MRTARARLRARLGEMFDNRGHCTLLAFLFLVEWARRVTAVLIWILRWERRD
jgi:hypothetical protein